MAIILANNAKSTLAAAIGALDTTLTVTSGTETLFPSPTGGDYFYVTLEDSTKTVREIVKCTARSTTTLTIVRAQDGTSANIFALGSTVEMRVNKAALTDTISAATSAASAAATLASAAATSASSASTSASSASTSAGTATTQAGIATTQATNASNSATSAASSASAAAASAASGMYSAVQDKSANYTVVAGDAGDLIRVTTTSGAITITLPLISGTGIGDGFKIAVVKWTSDSNVVNIARSGSDTINGATSAQIGSQYSQIVFVADLETSQWFASQSGLGATNINVDTFSGNGSTTAFTLTSDPSTKNNTAVYISGVYQQKSTYSVSGTTLTFTTAPPTGTSNIEVAYSTPLAIGTPSDGTVTTAKIASSVTLTTPTIDTITSAASTALTLKSAGTTAVTIDTAQNVGIGTASPDAKLSLKSPSVSGTQTILTGVAATSSTDLFALTVNQTTDVTTIGTPSGYAAPFAFQTNGTERMRIDSSGNLLVGTTTISAGIKSKVYYASATAGNFIGSWYSDSGSTENLRASFRVDGGLANYSGNNANLSDRREKTNFSPAGNYLEKICAIPIQTYNFIYQNLAEDSDLTLGAVAQDVQAVAPELVTESNWGTEENPKMRLSIYQTDLQYALMKSIQELKAINDTQAETLSQQATLINALTARITALENK
ncbi:Intramolecular chaperone auto-processing domain containing protein [uncultured Caudovirales phage]|uniref:Intramolecular chaperone auto-processing domain containing protein n=1 Tax=uncultured Caudovirales phage TaxID=2100421 RepID=A0A6J5LG85_9CAUD|nr:Intramolecular chaperone auto-processing domain containing protein [uncultured Caudovirales phage]